MGLLQVIKCVCMCGCVWRGGGQDFVLKVRWQAEDSIHLDGMCFCAGHPSKPFGPIRARIPYPYAA